MLLEDVHFVKQKINILICENLVEEFQRKFLDPKCAICGNTPIKKDSNHYFFKLSDFSDELKKWLLNNQNLQQDIEKYVLNWMESGLQDWDITRDLIGVYRYQT